MTNTTESSQELSQEKKIQVLKRAFEDDIQAFGEFFFPHHLQLATPPFHQDLYRLYQQFIQFLGIAAPRGHAKSTITDLVYLAWAIVHNKIAVGGPSLDFGLLISDTYTQAELFLDTVKAEFESNERLRDFYGDMVTDTWSGGRIVVAVERNPDGTPKTVVMIKAVGAGMKVRGLKWRGSRPKLALIDDLENDELVESLERREKLERWFNKALLPSIAKDGRVIMIGTILHYDSLLNKVIGKDTYQQFTKRLYRAVNERGALWPEHLDLLELEQIKSDYMKNGMAYAFYQEYQNDPVSGENRKFKLEKINYYGENEERLLSSTPINTYITIDRAYSTQKTADFTGIIVVSVDMHNNWYVRMAERFKGTEDELVDKIFDLHGYWKPRKIGMEQKAFEYTFKATLEREMRTRNTFFLVEEMKDLGTNKNVRIEGLVPRFNTGSIYLLKNQTDLIDELITFPSGRYDDLIDALAYQLDMTKPADPKGQQQQSQSKARIYGRNYRPTVTM